MNKGEHHAHEQDKHRCSNAWARPSPQLCFATSGGAEVAAAEPAEDDLIEEIIVTANKRSQSVQDVAGSLSVLGADALDAKGIKDMYDIQFAVPSLHFGPQLGNQKNHHPQH